MQRLLRNLVLLSAGALLCVLAAYGQDDQPSLGDVARQARQQKQQKDAQADKAGTPNAAPNSTPSDPAAGGDPSPAANSGNAAAQGTKPAKHVITNDEIPQHLASTHTPDAGSSKPQNANSAQPANAQAGSEQVRGQISQMKSDIATLQSQIADLEQSIHYTGANCVSGCEQWNQHQQQKQQQADVLKQQLEERQKILEQTQEAARKQGFGSSVYDP